MKFIKIGNENFLKIENIESIGFEKWSEETKDDENKHRVFFETKNDCWIVYYDKYTLAQAKWVVNRIRNYIENNEEKELEFLLPRTVQYYIDNNNYNEFEYCSHFNDIKQGDMIRKNKYSNKLYMCCWADLSIGILTHQYVFASIIDYDDYCVSDSINGWEIYKTELSPNTLLLSTEMQEYLKPIITKAYENSEREARGEIYMEKIK